jgi:hypothetical protein
MCQQYVSPGASELEPDAAVVDDAFFPQGSSVVNLQHDGLAPSQVKTDSVWQGHPGRVPRPSEEDPRTRAHLVILALPSQTIESDTEQIRVKEPVSAITIIY